jgi:hypothetical protein
MVSSLQNHINTPHLTRDQYIYKTKDIVRRHGMDQLIILLTNGSVNCTKRKVRCSYGNSLTCNNTVTGRVPEADPRAPVAVSATLQSADITMEANQQQDTKTPILAPIVVRDKSTVHTLSGEELYYFHHAVDIHNKFTLVDGCGLHHWAVLVPE